MECIDQVGQHAGINPKTSKYAVGKMPFLSPGQHAGMMGHHKKEWWVIMKGIYISGQLSPLTTYKFLKAKFGLPNGTSMLFKSKTSDNLIHWHYSFQSKMFLIHFWGKTSGLEIAVDTNGTQVIEKSDWELLVTLIKACFGKYGKEMTEVQRKFERWSLFINPVSRMWATLDDLVNEMISLDLTEVEDYDVASTPEEMNVYYKELNKWVKNINRAATLGTSIRMLYPVFAESVINLIILVFQRDEYKNDTRLYENLIRQQIDIRVKSLHINCVGFERPIDGNDRRVKDFQTLMNSRNDFLHGNIDPNRLFVEEVFFDNGTIPLFDKDEGVIKKMMRKYCTNIELALVLKDAQTIENFLEYILCQLDENNLRGFVQIMSDRLPGINKSTNRLGCLFPAQLAEAHLGPNAK